MGLVALILAFRRRRQKDEELKASLRYLKPCLIKQTNKPSKNKVKKKRPGLFLGRVSDNCIKKPPGTLYSADVTPGHRAAFR